MARLEAGLSSRAVVVALGALHGSAGCSARRADGIVAQIVGGWCGARQPGLIGRVGDRPGGIGVGNVVPASHQ